MPKVPLNLLKILPPEDNNPLGFTVEIEPEFEEWFLKAQGLKEWDEQKFNTWFKTFMGDAIKDKLALNGRSDMQTVDIWSREGLDE